MSCTSVRFGFPNDEALAGHPLYGNGLSFYAAHEIIDSRWLEELRAVERHHPQAPPMPFADARHYLLAFHDSTLEAIARDIRVVARKEPKLLLPDSDLKGYRLSLVMPLGSKRGVGRGGFITSIHTAIDNFYREVMQSLRPWTPPAPKPPAHDAVATEDQPEATDEGPALLT